MLVLSRKKGETIVIAGGIRITILEANGRSTRLGIEAPREVSVMRSELLERPQEPACIGARFSGRDFRRPAEAFPSGAFPAEAAVLVRVSQAARVETGRAAFAQQTAEASAAASAAPIGLPECLAG